MPAANKPASPQPKRPKVLGFNLCNGLTLILPVHLATPDNFSTCGIANYSQ
jgi:hypothetical protein